MANILIINHSAPYGTSAAHDSLDLAFAYAAMEHQVSLVFTDDGVLQLLIAQQGKAIYQKTHSNAFHLLASEGIGTLYVDKVSLQERGLAVSDLWSDHTVMTREQLLQLRREADQIFHF